MSSEMWRLSDFHLRSACLHFLFMSLVWSFNHGEDLFLGLAALRGAIESRMAKEAVSKLWISLSMLWSGLGEGTDDKNISANEVAVVESMVRVRRTGRQIFELMWGRGKLKIMAL